MKLQNYCITWVHCLVYILSTISYSALDNPCCLHWWSIFTTLLKKTFDFLKTFCFHPFYTFFHFRMSLLKIYIAFFQARILYEGTSVVNGWKIWIMEARHDSKPCTPVRNYKWYGREWRLSLVFRKFHYPFRFNFRKRGVKK